MAPPKGKIVKDCWVCAEKTRHTVRTAVIVHESPYDYTQTTTVFVHMTTCDKCGTVTKE